MGRKVGQTVTLGRPRTLPHLVDVEAQKGTLATGHLRIVYVFQAESGRRKMIIEIADSLLRSGGCLRQEATLYPAPCGSA